MVDLDGNCHDVESEGRTFDQKEVYGRFDADCQYNKMYLGLLVVPG